MLNKELFISSYEYDSFAIPRKVKIVKEIELVGKNCLFVKFDKPVNGEEYGQGNELLIDFLLVTRFDKKALWELKKFPIGVHVFIMKISENGSYNLEEMTNIAWANLYDKYSDALSKAI